MRSLLITMALCLVPSLAQAQAADSFTARYYTAGTNTLINSETFLASSAAIICGQPVPPATIGTINPGRIFWNEIPATGLMCVWASPTTSLLRALPVGTYEATLTTTVAGVTSAESARSPFSRVAPPPAPTGVRVIQ